MRAAVLLLLAVGLEVNRELLQQLKGLSRIMYCKFARMNYLIRVKRV